MSTETSGRPDLARGYETAMTLADLHMADCPDCVRGRCGRGDDLMEAEYRQIEALRDRDPAAADTYDRATWPTEGRP